MKIRIRATGQSTLSRSRRLPSRQGRSTMMGRNRREILFSQARQEPIFRALDLNLMAALSAAESSRSTGKGREPFLAWPGMSGLRLTLPLSYLFFKIFYSVY
ncbi:MAG TPA: hypothetical protein VGP73_15395, partial [Thermoanaerobaculia bacterium]